jgi:uncharacterized protein YbjT (DUF2867 family)
MPSDRKISVLVIGATGSIGKLVVREALKNGHDVRALVRSESKARALPSGAQAVIGDLTQPDTLTSAVEGVEAIVFTHGSDGGGKQGAEAIDYGGVRNVLQALGDAKPRITLMTAIGVTYREGSYNRSTESHDWKRRGERLVRASGCEYTIVRPAWFDYNKADEHQLVFLQGDTRRAGTSADGVIARQQLADVLVASLTSPHAVGKTFELVAVKGSAQENLEPLFAALEADRKEGIDGIRDEANQPVEAEPKRVQEDLQRQKAQKA